MIPLATSQRGSDHTTSTPIASLPSPPSLAPTYPTATHRHDTNNRRDHLNDRDNTTGAHSLSPSPTSPYPSSSSPSPSSSNVSPSPSSLSSSSIITASSPLHILILCLGDLGRSPRMQYHARSCAETKWQIGSVEFDCLVDFVGYEGTEVMKEITDNPHIRIHRFKQAIKYSIADEAATTPTLSSFSSSSSSSSPRGVIYRMRNLFLAAVKVLIQLLQLLYILVIRCSAPDVILVQNPPSIPTLFVAWLVAFLRHSSLIIDWHNFGWSLIQLSRGDHDRLTTLSKSYEHFFARLATNHLCVTQAMQQTLAKDWGVTAKVLYDRPAIQFHRLSIKEIHHLYRELEEQQMLPIEKIKQKLLLSSSRYKQKQKQKQRQHTHTEESTLLTMYHNGEYRMRSDRPAVIISSTSWTADEDFSLLIDAMKQYDLAVEEDILDTSNSSDDDDMADNKSIVADEEYEVETKMTDIEIIKSIDNLRTVVLQQAHNRRLHRCHLPPLLVLITGKGPLLSAFLQDISTIPMRHVYIHTLFLPFEYYPKLLGSADIGLCFHTSSSGMDLPMKVVDMFGAGLPVCAVDFNCLSELVTNGETGCIFSSNNGGEQLNLFLQYLLGEGRDPTYVYPESTQQLDRLRENVIVWAQHHKWNVSWERDAKPLFLQQTTQSNTTNITTLSPAATARHTATHTATSAVSSVTGHTVNSHHSNINPSSSSSTTSSSSTPTGFSLRSTLSSPTALFATLYSHALQLWNKIPLQYRVMIIFMILAVLYRIYISYSFFLSTIYDSFFPLLSISSPYDLSWSSLYSWSLYFAHTPIASLIVLGVILSSCFWLFVVYRVNRAVGDEKDNINTLSHNTTQQPQHQQQEQHQTQTADNHNDHTTNRGHRQRIQNHHQNQEDDADSDDLYSNGNVEDSDGMIEEKEE